MRKTRSEDLLWCMVVKCRTFQELLWSLRPERGKNEQAGTSPSRRHIQGTKIAKRLPSVKYSLLQYSKIENFFEITYSKNGPSGAPGLASASPWRAKVSQCRKTERGDPLGSSNIHSVAKQPKNWRGDPLGKKISGKKVSQCRKKLEGGTLWSPRVWYGTRENRKNLFGSVR